MKVKVFDLTVRQINKICDKVGAVCTYCPFYDFCYSQGYGQGFCSATFSTLHEDDEIEVDEEILK